MVSWKLKHTLWGIFSALVILSIGYGVIVLTDITSLLWIIVIAITTILLSLVPIYTVLFGTNKDELFIRGLPLQNRIKIGLVTVGLFLLIANNVLPVLSENINYPGRGVVSLGLILLMVVLSIGSKTAETIVIGTAVIILVSVSWDFSVEDVSLLRKNILIGSIAILGISLSLGRVSLLNLTSIIRNQIGVGRKVRK